MLRVPKPCSQTTKEFSSRDEKLLIIVSGGIYFITLACILDKNSEEPLLLLHTSHSLSLWPQF